MNIARLTAIVVPVVLSNAVTPQATAANLVSNGSFESAIGLAANATLSPGSTAIDAWTVIGSGTLIWCDSSSYCARPASQGAFSVDLTGTTNVAPYAGVSQTIATVAGSVYQLTFDLAGRSDAVPVTVRASAGATTQSFTNPSATWATQSMSFTASAAATSIALVGLSAGGSGLVIQVDDVQVFAAVPEPATWPLLMVGTSVIALAGRRRGSPPAPVTAPP